MQNINLSPEQEKLAYEIAASIGDLKALKMHRLWVSKYPDRILKDIQRSVMSVRDKDIKTSRGAYFNSLIQQYEISPWD